MPRPKNATKYKDEPKKRVNFALTATAIEQLDHLADSIQVSRSELVELFARSQLQLPKAG